MLLKRKTKKSLVFVKDKVLNRTRMYLLAQLEQNRVSSMFKNRYSLEIPTSGNTIKWKKLWIDFSNNAEGFIFKDDNSTVAKFRCKLYFECAADVTWFSLRIAGDFI